MFCFTHFLYYYRLFLCVIFCIYLPLGTENNNLDRLFPTASFMRGDNSGEFIRGGHLDAKYNHSIDIYMIMNNI